MKTMQTLPTQARILNAALAVIRERGYAATTVDELCSAAGVTKGAFFHYFDSKEDLAIAATDHWSKVTGDLFANAAYRKHADPLDRVLGYIDFRKELLSGAIPEFTCFVGTMVQEAFGTHPKIREACRRSIFGHAAELEKDIDLAKGLYAPEAEWTPESLALYTQSVLQGAFILAKADEGSGVASEAIDHLRRYFELILSPKTPKKKEVKP